GLADAAAAALTAGDLVPSGASLTAPQARPLTRREYGRALVLYAMRIPFNLAVLGGTLIAGLIFGVLPFAVPVGLILYAAAVTVSCFDGDVGQKVLELERAKRPELAAPDQVSAPPGRVSPRVAALLQRAEDKQARIADAIERAELPYEEVSEEVERLMT